MKHEKATFHFGRVVKRKGYYYISNQTLDEIRNGAFIDGVYHRPVPFEFNDFLKEQNLILSQIDDKWSIIKKINHVK